MNWWCPTRRSSSRRADGEAAADQFTYRDGGLPGDDIVGVAGPGPARRCWPLAEQPSFWATGRSRRAPSWDERPQSWASPDTDVWFIQREQVGPEQYAETWLQDASENRDRRLYQDSYAAYLDDFASRSVDGHWLRDDLAAASGAGGPRSVTALRGDHLSDRAARRAAYGGRGRTRRLAGRPRPGGRAPPDCRGRHRGAAPAARRRTPRRHLAAPGAGLRRTNLLSTELAGYVSACDGDLSVGQIIGALEALLGGGEDFNGGAFHGGLLTEVGNLVRDGFLLPA